MHRKQTLSLNLPSMADPGIMEDDESHKMALGPVGLAEYQGKREKRGQSPFPGRLGLDVMGSATEKRALTPFL
jgi:hypothetical protein